MIQVLGVIAGIVCVLGVARLLWVLFTRFPVQELGGERPASWGRLESPDTHHGREPTFDRSVDRIESASATSEGWRKLLAYLDSLDRFIDPTNLPSVGLRHNSRSAWKELDDVGVPTKLDLDYLNARLAALEQHAGVDNKRTTI